MPDQTAELNRTTTEANAARLQVKALLRRFRLACEVGSERVDVLRERLEDIRDDPTSSPDAIAYADACYRDAVRSWELDSEAYTAAMVLRRRTESDWQWARIASGGTT